MAQKSKNGIKVAYNDVLSEEQAANIIAKKKTMKTINAVIFVVIAMTVLWLAHQRKEMILDQSVTEESAK